MLGAPLTINQTPVTVIGVMPKGFAGPLARADVHGWLPLGRPVRSAVRALRPDLVVGPPRSMEAMIRKRMGATPFGAWLLSGIAALAVALAAIGLMATIGWWVRQRRRELGVRIALGATRGGVTRLVFRQGMTLAVVGVGLGCGIAVLVNRYLAGWIYGVTPLDKPTFAGCATLMLLVAGCAVYFPVRTATSVEPVAALRAE
jgi:hypothetical protein